ncbi:Fe-S cluster assembly ATPase SufC [Zooshikella ganghwensis]|uniref:Fe-S cluster assembly ATPase SufC n=1 Tax=Zooshikella ganghwensis TaxID=202772 RepID=A0A4P9VKT9_9GAMM|nr:Fe-S cluster assembly ATPase SufC [Zooshikella ganghwensis]RDH43928.1 Fe-S cluster assembly ATPase SufC [Zooshikella ganghwensis]
MLEIQSLAISVANKTIVEAIDLTINAGEIHVLMGPNGVGKSTLTRALLGDADYTIESGSLRLGGLDLLPLSIEQRAHQGLFVAFQHPVTIPGVSNLQFYKAMVNAHRQVQNLEPLDAIELLAQVKQAAQQSGLNEDFLYRGLNDGFSGGEKKRNELLQMLLLSPRIAVVDEIDSGLDVDALKIIGQGIRHLQQQGTGFLLITHYPHWLEYLTPDQVHILLAGRIVQSGGVELADQVANQGFQAFAA